MIELNTGIPGSGKTLSMVQKLAKLQARWEAHPEESRAVFILGVPDLKLPHSPVPLVSMQLTKAGAPQLVPDWDAMPHGSLVIIDEAQGCFPPRSSAVAAPAHVAWLNTHRHKGFDIWLTTQHPRLIDSTVRALVGKHQHYRRMFGGARAVCYEWDACSDSLAGMKDAVKTYFGYPKDVFKFYKSAEIHTKQSFKIPLWLGLPFLGIALGLYFVPKAYNTLHSGISGQGVAASTAPLSAALPAPVKHSEGGATAPPPPNALQVIAKAESPQISACLASASKCQCYTHNGVKIPLSDFECREAANSPSDKFKFDSSYKTL